MTKPYEQSQHPESNQIDHEFVVLDHLVENALPSECSTGVFQVNAPVDVDGRLIIGQIGTEVDKLSVRIAVSRLVDQSNAGYLDFFIEPSNSQIKLSRPKAVNYDFPLQNNTHLYSTFSAFNLTATESGEYNLQGILSSGDSVDFETDEERTDEFAGVKKFALALAQAIQPKAGKKKRSSAE